MYNKILERLPHNFTRSVEVVEVSRDYGTLVLIGICDHEYFRMVFSESGMSDLVSVEFNLNVSQDFVFYHIEAKYKELGMEMEKELDDIQIDNVYDFGELMYEMYDDLDQTLIKMGYSGFKDPPGRIPYAENVYLCSPVAFLYVQGEFEMNRFERIIAKVVEMRGLGLRMLIDNKIAPFHQM